MEGEVQERGFRPAAAYKISFKIASRDNGKLIGKGGETVKALSSAHNVRINIPKGQEPQTEVTVEGAKADVDVAVAKITGILGYAVAAPVAQEAPKVDLSASGNIREALFFPDLSNAQFQRFFTFLSSATRSVDIAVFTLSDQRISDLLLAQHKKGVKIRIVSDNDTVSNVGSDVTALAKAGIAVRLDGLPGALGGPSLRDSTKGGASSLMHHKFCLLDGKASVLCFCCFILLTHSHCRCC